MTIANPYFHGQNNGTGADARLKRWASVASLSVATILISLKFFAFLGTNSVSMLSSLMDSCFDMLASLVALISVTQAASPADRDHRFGHGKIEALGALAQSLFVLGSALFLFAESMRRFFRPITPEDPGFGIAVMIVSIVLTTCLIAYQRFVIRRTQSVIVAADSLHYTGDVLMNLGVLAALALGYLTKWPYFDPLFAFAIAIRLLMGAWEIGKTSFDILLDKELPDAERQKIKDIVKSHARVRGIHDLRTRSTGERVFMEFHIEVDPVMTIAEVHDVMDDVEIMLFAAFEKAEVLIHPEPEGLDDHRLDHILKKNQST
jgi:ferrous-iron efflux pump FieF